MNDEVRKEQQEVEETSVHIGMLDARGKRKSPWSWVGTLYYAEGIPYILAMTVSVIMYKKMGISNTDIAYFTSLLYLPWVVKPLWSPIVDIFKTKRWWIVVMQFCLGLTMGAVAFGIPLPNFFKITLVFFWFMAFFSATHDIACDGFYMLGLSKHQQAWFVGVRSTFYRLAMLTGQGLLIILVGWIEASSGLPSVTVDVEAYQNSKEPAAYIKYMDLSTDEKAALENKNPAEMIEMFARKAESADTLEEKATYAFLANNILQSARKENPNSPELATLNTLAQKAAVPLNGALQQQIQEMQQKISPIEGDLHLVASAETLKIPIKQISRDDSNLTVYVAQQWNKVQGQEQKVLADVTVKKKQPGVIKRLWRSGVSMPLSTFLKKNFRAVRKEISPVAGNVGIVYFHLSSPPEKGKTVTATFGRRSGDKSIDLKEGMRFVFNEDNWNKPVKALTQIDYRLKEPTTAEFRLTAGNIPLSWSVTFFLGGGLFIFFSIYHFFSLPHPVADTSRYEESHKKGQPIKLFDLAKEFILTFVTFFQKKGIVPMLLFLLLYRFAESQLVKMSSPFLLDTQEAGGLALTTGQVGFAYGTVGLVCLSIGGILGGIVAARDGLKKWLLFMAIAINIPDAVYVFLSQLQPSNFGIVCACVGLETFGYGFGFTAYMLYMIFIAEGKYKTAHFAITTGFMALGMMIPGMWSGWIQDIIGYKNFFIWIMISTIPSFLVLLLIPLDPEFGKKKKKE